MIETGTLLQDRFVIEEQIGRGGMGAVYIATDRKFGSRAAIKERAYEDPELARAFEREARLLNSLHHPILPHVSDYFSEEGRYFLVMEHIAGEDLSTVLARDGAFPADQVVRWTLELLDGLDYLHSQEPLVIHRDIKPGNLKLTPRGNIMLLDFGLAKETESNTLAGRSVFGYSRRYSPLEQIEGTGTDARSDIFSLGATVFHVITGEPPIDALARASAIVAGRPDPLVLASEINPQVPEKVASIINTALALNADYRFVSANAMRAALEYAISDNSPAIEEAALKEPIAVVDRPPVAAAPIKLPGASAVETEDRGLHAEALPPVGVQPAAAFADHSPGGFSPVLQNPVRVRFIQPLWQRPSVWTAALIGCLLVISYVIYKTSTVTTTVDAPVQHSSPAPAAAELQNNVSDATMDDPSNSVSAELSTNEPVEEVATTAQIPAKRRANTETPKRSGEPERTDVVDEAARSKPEATKPRISAPQPTRQRSVRPAFERPVVEVRDPVYGIETIFTGVTSPGTAKQDRRQRRSLSKWEQEQLRQRFQEMMQDTRRWQPPF
jgi:serine/threonine protein kinase